MDTSFPDTKFHPRYRHIFHPGNPMPNELETSKDVKYGKFTPLLPEKIPFERELLGKIS